MVARGALSCVVECTQPSLDIRSDEVRVESR